MNIFDGIFNNPEARSEGRAGMVAGRRPVVTSGRFFPSQYLSISTKLKLGLP